MKAKKLVVIPAFALFTYSTLVCGQPVMADQNSGTNILAVESVDTPTQGGNFGAFSSSNWVGYGANINTAASASNTASNSDVQVATSKDVQASQTTVNLSNVSLSGDQLSLSGKVVSADGDSTPFSLAGTLYDGGLTGTVEGSMNDSSGNFDILRFEIVNNPQKGVFLDPNAKNADVPFLGMYLERKGTRDITFLEAPASQVLGANNTNTIESSYTTFSAAPVQDNLWVERVFQADSITSGISKTPPAGVSMVKSDAMSPMSVTLSTNYPYYNAVYDFAGNEINDTSNLEESVTYNASNAISPPISSQLEVLSTTYDNETTDQVLDQSGFQYGNKGPLALTMTCPDNGPQRVEYLQTGGYGNIPGTWTVSWGYTLAYDGAGIGVTYTPGSTQSVDSDALMQAPAGGAYSFEWKLPAGDYLNAQGEYVGTVWTAPSYGGSGNVNDRFDFMYNLYNTLNETNYGTKDDYITVTTQVS